jgi:electron transfer flavoprotein beta subunit
VVSAGGDATKPLRHAAALGADEVAFIQLDPSELDPSASDHHVVATLLAAYVRSSGGADLVLCGRQASDDDQGVVPALIGEALEMPVVTVARAIERADAAGEPNLRVTRVTADGDEVVEVATPAVVTISNELGEPRYPTAANTLRARRVQPAVVSLSDLSLDEAELAPRAVLARQFVPKVEGHCEWVSGDTASEVAERLVARLREDGVLPRAGSPSGQATTDPGT